MCKPQVVRGRVGGAFLSVAGTGAGQLFGIPALLDPRGAQRREAGAQIDLPPDEKLDLLVKGGAAISLSVEPCAKLPMSRDRDCRFTRIGLSGVVNGSLSGSFNYAPVALKSSISFFRSAATSSL